MRSASNLHRALKGADGVIACNTNRNGSVGAYSPAAGLREVRAHVAAHLAARDGGVRACADDVWLGAGATDLIKAVLALFAEDVDGKPPGDHILPLSLEIKLFFGSKSCTNVLLNKLTFLAFNKFRGHADWW